MIEGHHCKSCVFYQPNRHRARGECHRFPPTVVMMTKANTDEHTFEYARPIVRENDGCGEHGSFDECEHELGDEH
jgi:hypothetical protein